MSACFLSPHNRSSPPSGPDAVPLWSVGKDRFHLHHCHIHNCNFSCRILGREAGRQQKIPVGAFNGRFVFPDFDSGFPDRQPRRFRSGRKFLYRSDLMCRKRNAGRNDQLTAKKELLKK